MQLQPQQVLELATGRTVILGRVVVEAVRDGLLLAQFTPASAYAEMKPLFDEFEDAVDQQMFTVADEAAAAIGALGLFLRSLDGRERLPVHDVQIMNGHDLSCRLSPLPATTARKGTD